MTLVKNRSDVPHRYYDYARKAYVVWAPGEVKDVHHAIATHVCQAHPNRMELWNPGQPEPQPVEVVDDIAEKAVSRARRGGRRRSA